MDEYSHRKYSAWFSCVKEPSVSCNSKYILDFIMVVIIVQVGELKDFIHVSFILKTCHVCGPCLELARVIW